ncbi:S-layer homology domain-containing protein [Paenibacillus sp. P96]|uniref:S-layer homology domain-containing protein n=1 Tax=Paenibacillus zeirhizosphaerae TaxID=2987519 RepID=A0ABT9FP35_9BACL|nr:S-layer homology domain-containing protein [Paenibacillus sp. P96]MDP4096487.1 S-layer homology domain-containing protein [Paenibacillus sp. P96]
MGKYFRKVVTGALGTGLVLSAFSSASAATENLSTHWAGDQIKRWVAIGTLGGYSDGTLKPDGSITRAEFISLVNRTFGSFTSSAPTVADTTYGSTGSGFSDLSSGSWAYNDIMTAVQAGYINGYADDRIRPNQQVTRQEAAAIIAKVIGLTPGSASTLTGFSDADEIASWSRGSVAAVIGQGYMNGYPDGSFKPEKELTRAEAVVILDAASGYTLDDTDNIIAPDENTGSVIDDTYGEDDNMVLPPVDTDAEPEPAEDTDTSTDTEDTAAADSGDAVDTQVSAPDVDAVESGESSITGTADPGVTIRVYSEDDTLLGSDTADEYGLFEVSVSEVTGDAVLRVIAEDADGNESTEVEITVVSEDGNDSTSTEDEDSIDQ